MSPREISFYHPFVMDAWRARVAMEGLVGRAAYHIEKADDWNGFVEKVLGRIEEEVDGGDTASHEEMARIMKEELAKRRKREDDAAAAAMARALEKAG